MLERLDEPRVVALVQADGRLIQNVEHADKAGTDLRRQPNALGLAAGERARRAGERQIAKTHVDEEAQTGVDFLENRRGDHAVLFAEGQRSEERLRVDDGQIGGVGDGFAADRHRQNLRAEAFAAAVRAGRLAHQTVVIGFGGVALRFGGASLRGGNDAFKRRGEGVRIAVGARVVDVQRLAPAAVENHIQRFFGKPVQRRIHRKAVFLAQRLKEHARLRAGLKVAPSHDVEGVFVQALAPVRHNQVGIDLLQHAQPRARRARAERAVEGKRARRKLFHGDAALRAGEVLGKEHFALARPDIRDDDAAGEGERRFQRIRQAGADIFAQNQAVYDDLDVVLFLFGQRGRFRRVADFPVDPDADKALPDHVFQNLDVFALFAAHDRREQLHARAFRQGEQPIDHLIDRLFADFPSAPGAVRHADAGIEQTQIVVNFRHRADCGTRVFARRLLVDGDGGGKAVDGIHVRLFHLPQKLTRVGGKRFDVAPLPLGVERVERQRGFAAAGKAGEDDELVARQGQVKALEVVLANAADDDVFLHGELLLDTGARRQRML